MGSRERYIRMHARQLGLDPDAVVAIASVEGSAALHGGKSIGDHGTSFGPFQLHEGGALPAGKGSAWAHSNAGIDYALNRMASVAGGLHGRQAVSAISSRFERPADVPGEIAKAMSYYGSGGSSEIAPAPAQPNVGRPTYGAAQGLSQDAFRSMAASVLLQQSMNTAQGGPPDSSGLLALAMARQQMGAAQDVYGGQGAPAAQGLSKGAVRAGSGGLIDPVQGKLIGRPYQGTHNLGNWESDNAVDIATPVGTPLRATQNGVIGQQFGSLGAPGGSRFAGLRLHLVTPGNEFYYAHLSRFAPGIRPGARVRKGQIIGYSGEANGVAHLHIGAKNGNPVNLFNL